MTSRTSSKGRGSEFLATHVVARPMTDVTPDNYSDCAVDYMTLAGKGSIVARWSGNCQGVRYEADPKRWGAWLAYFKRKGMKTAFFESRDFYTVPADWPHQFDADVSLSEDTEAGEAHLLKVRRDQARRFDIDAAAKRVAVERRWRRDVKPAMDMLPVSADNGFDLKPPRTQRKAPEL